jgi:23S rRNA (uracil1939-C5)-methyltransferase
MRVIDLSIEDVAFGGKGVGRDQGKIVFVPYVTDGELVRAEVIREKKHFAEAALVEVLEPSPHRVGPGCPYFGRCGGCAYQHLNYPHQLTTKERQVRDVLRRIGKFDNVSVQPIVPSPEQYGYRNRITAHVRDGVIGFFERDSHHLIDIERCPISREEVNAKLAELRASNPRDGHYTLRATEGARVFSQTNDGVANALRDLIGRLIPPHQELLVDAFCGAGFFAKALLPKFERVIGIDWDRFAIGEAKKSAVEKETYIAGDVAVELERLVPNASWPIVHSDTGSGPVAGETSAESRCHLKSATLIVDPPATGLTNVVRSAIVDLAPAHFVYVSCNPATLARDLKELAGHFEIKSVTPLDMFPQTAEIEVAVHMTRSAKL